MKASTAAARQPGEGIDAPAAEGRSGAQCNAAPLVCPRIAFDANAAPIVQLILAWMPDAMNERSKNSNSIALHSLTTGWRSTVWQAKSGTPAGDASRRFKFNGERELMRLMIRFKADPNRVPKYADSPLMQVIRDPDSCGDSWISNSK